VFGAVTVLRMGVSSLLVRPVDQTDGAQPQQQEQERQQHCCGIVTSAGQVVRCGALIGSVAALGGSFAPRQPPAAAEAAAARAAASSSSGVPNGSTEPAITTSSSTAAGDGGSSGAADAANASAPSSSRSSSTARAVVVLGGPLVEGTPSLMLVLPPHSLGPDQHAVIRGLQYGPGMGVAPPGKWLLHLSAQLPGSCAAPSPAGSRGGGAILAEAVLAPAVAALVQTGQLQAGPGSGGSGGGSGSSGNALHAAASHGTDSGTASSSGVDLRPRAEAALYYMHDLPSSAPAPGVAAALPGNVLAVPDADPGVPVGAGSAVARAEALFRAHFPDVQWITEAAEAEAGAAAAAVVGEEEEDAMAELLSALEGLGAGGSGQQPGGVP
jgi:hypothetical protein